jgi:hypothetical protein
MTYKEKLEAKRLQLERDNQYLLKQIFKLAANKSDILIRIKRYRNKFTKNDKYNHIHINRLAKLLGVNKRTIYLLDNKEFFQMYFPWDNRIFNIKKVEKFFKSSPKM